MVRKIASSGGWRKRTALQDNHGALEQAATRAVATLPTNNPAWRAATIEQLTAPMTRRHLPAAVITATRTAATQIFDLEAAALAIAPPDPASIEAVSYRNRLRGLLSGKPAAERQTDRWVRAIGRCLQLIADAIPQQPADAVVFGATVPLIDMAPAPADLVAQIVALLLELSPKNDDAFSPGAELARGVQEALLNTSRISAEAAAKNPYRLVSPQQSGLTGEDLVAAFLGRDNPLFTLLTTPVPFAIPRIKWSSHGVVFARPNHGKSQLLGSVAYALLQRGDCGALILDPHGDLFHSLLALDLFHPEHGPLRHRLDVIDITDPRGLPPFNIIATGRTTEVGAQQTFAFLLSSFASEWTPKQATVSNYLLKLLRTIPNAQIDTLRLLLTDPAKSVATSQFADAITALPAFERDFFDSQFFTPRMKETTSAMGWKIFNVLSNPAFKEMFSATHSCLDAFACMQGKRIVLVNAGNQLLGEEGMEIFLQFLLGQFYAAAFLRAEIPEADRHLFMLMVDEASHVFKSSPHVGRILTETRKYNVAFFGATQLTDHMSPEVKTAVYGATAIRFAASASADSSTALAREMFCTSDFIRSMRSFERSHAEWAVQVTDLTHNRAVKMTLPSGIVHAASRMTAADIEIVRDRNHARLMATVPAPAPVPPAAPPILAPPTLDPAPALEAKAVRDFGTIEKVSFLNLTCNGCLDTGAQISALIVTDYERIGTARQPRLRFTITSPRAGTHTFERPIVGESTLAGIHAATAMCPRITLEITLDGYTALQQFAVTTDPEPQQQPVILGSDFFSAAPFTARILPAETMLTEHRQRPAPPRTEWDSDHGEAEV
jgi:hypothetical protein